MLVCVSACVSVSPQLPPGGSVAISRTRVFFSCFSFTEFFFFTEFHSSLLITDDDLIDDGSPWRKTKSIDNNTHTHTHTKEIMITLSDKCVAMATRRTCQTKMDRYRDDFTGPLVFFFA